MTDFAATLHAVLAPSGEAGQAAAPTSAEWEELLRRAPGQCHPWIAACVERRFPGEPLPAAVRDALSAASKGAAIGHLQRQSLLRRLIPALDAAGVPFVVLKGAALAHVVYPAPSLRTMGDLDLWTAPEDLERATQVALDAGLRYHTGLADLTPATRQLRVESTRVLEWPDSSLRVEIHGALKSLDGISPDWLTTAWQRSERRAFGDLEARVLHPEDMLTHLVLHCGRHHHFEYSLRALVDIGLLLAREGARLSWPDLLRCWQREHIDTWALLTLALAHEVAGARVPGEILRRIPADAAFAELVATARRQVLAPGAPTPPAVTRFVTSTPRERAAWLVYRVTAWYWKGPAGLRRTPAEVLREGGRRMRHDLLHKLPRYARGLMDGSLRGSEFRRRRELALGKRRLDALVAAAEAAHAGDSYTR